MVNDVFMVEISSHILAGSAILMLNLNDQITQYCYPVHYSRESGCAVLQGLHGSSARKATGVTMRLPVKAGALIDQLISFYIDNFSTNIIAQ